MSYAQPTQLLFSGLKRLDHPHQMADSPVQVNRTAVGALLCLQSNCLDGINAYEHVHGQLITRAVDKT